MGTLARDSRCDDFGSGDWDSRSRTARDARSAEAMARANRGGSNRRGASYGSGVGPRRFDCSRLVDTVVTSPPALGRPRPGLRGSSASRRLRAKRELWLRGGSNSGRVRSHRRPTWYRHAGWQLGLARRSLVSREYAQVDVMFMPLTVPADRTLVRALLSGRGALARLRAHPLRPRRAQSLPQARDVRAEDGQKFYRLRASSGPHSNACSPA